MLRTLLIDDEPLARGVLRKLLSAHPTLIAVGEAGTFAEATARLAVPDYDLVLLDIQLRGGNGFDLVPAVRGRARIIFVTAYDRYALRAFEVNALDYLLKPVTAERFGAAIARLTPEPGPDAAPSARSESSDTSSADAPDLVARARGAGGLAADDRVLIRTDEGDRFVPVANLAAILSNGNYCDVMLRTGQRLFTRRAMKTWEDLLPPHLFVRVHRQSLVNLRCVENHQRISREAIEVRVTGLREPVAVSRHSVAGLLARLAALHG